MSKGENRSAARLAAVQALYQMDVTGKGIVDILAEFEAHWIGREIEGAEYKPAEIAYFRNILEGVLADLQIPELMLEHDRHFFRKLRAQPVGNAQARRARVEGDEEMMLAGQAVAGNVGEHLADDAAQRVLCEQIVTDKIGH